MKKQPKYNPASIKSIAHKIISEQKDALPNLLKALSSDGLPEDDSPFKLYFNGKLIGSAEANVPDKPIKPTDNEPK